MCNSVRSLLIAGLCLTSGLTNASAQCVLPNQLQLGDLADATKVSSNFAALATCAEDGAPAGSTNSIQFNAGSSSPGGVTPLTNGETIIGSSGNPPQAGSFTAGSGIAISKAPSSIVISATGSGTGESVDWLNASAIAKPDADSFTMRTSSSAPVGSAVTATSRGMLLSASATPDNRAMMAELSLPPGNWQVTMLAIYTGTVSSYVLPAIAVRDATVNRAIQFGVGGNGSSYRFAYMKSSGGIGLNTNTGEVTSRDTGFSTPSEPTWTRLTYNGSTLSWSFSRDGQNFTTTYSISSTDYLTNLSTVGPSVMLYEPSHPSWNVGYHILSWSLTSI